MEKILSEKFNTSEGLEVGLESWSRSYYQPINIRSSNYLKSEKNSKGEPKVFNQEQLDKCEYKKIIYKCINGGADRTNKDKEKNTKSNNVGCPFYLNWNYNEKKELYECTGSCLEHNHEISEQHFRNYAFNRQLTDTEIEYVIPLLNSKGQMRDIVREMKRKFKKEVSIKDLHNLKEKLFNKPSKHLTETERLLNFIQEYTNGKNVTIKTKMNENNELECLFVQTDYMRDWYHNYGHLTHIDATYCVMVENFLLFHSLCQNENLNGVPVAYCFMRSETKENLEFYYEKLTLK